MSAIRPSAVSPVGGRDINLRAFAKAGVQLYGLLTGLAADGQSLPFASDLKSKLDPADRICNRIYNGINASINASIAKHIDKHGFEAPPPGVCAPVWEPEGERSTLDLRRAGITSGVWCIGLQPDFGWLDATVFNGCGQPGHVRGVTAVPGPYFIGLPWPHTWGSGRFSGVARDARYLAEQIEARRAAAPDAQAPRAAESLLS